LPTDQGFDEWFGFETTDIIYWTADHQVPLRDIDYIREGRKGERPRALPMPERIGRRPVISAARPEMSRRTPWTRLPGT
jgi:hypothetical protein